MIKRGGPHQGFAAGKGLAPAERGIGLAHCAQIRHQLEGIREIHREKVAVDHRQGEARTLQEPAQITHLGHRRDTGADAACGLAFSLQQGDAKLGQGLAAKQRGQEQAVELQQAPGLQQRARQVVDPVGP